jgi:hypothetical protein
MKNILKNEYFDTDFPSLFLKSPKTKKNSKIPQNSSDLPTT